MLVQIDRGGDGRLPRFAHKQAGIKPHMIWKSSKSATWGYKELYDTCAAATHERLPPGFDCLGHLYALGRLAQAHIHMRWILLALGSTTNGPISSLVAPWIRHCVETPVFVSVNYLFGRSSGGCFTLC